MGFQLYRTTAVFINMFASMAVELPIATRFIVASYRWYLPLLFGGAAALVIGKQFLIRRIWPNLTTTLAVIVAIDITTNQIVASLYRPLVDLMERLNR